MENHRNGSETNQNRLTLDYAPATRPDNRVRSFLLRGCLAGALLAALFLLLEPTIHSNHRPRPTIKCAVQLRNIGIALMLYASNNGHRFPDSLEGFAADPGTGFDTGLLCCPSTSATPARGASQSATLAAFASGNHCSYVYLGRGIKDSDRPDRILVYEPTSNHTRGSNVLFRDGHVEFLTLAKIQSLLQSTPPTTGKNANPATTESLR